MKITFYLFIASFCFVSFFSCNQDDSGFRSNYCESALLGGFKKYRFDTLYARSAHNGPFGCVVTYIDLEKNQKPRFIFDSVSYGDPDKWKKLISNLKISKNTEIIEITEKVVNLNLKIQQNGFNKQSSNIDSIIVHLHQDLEFIDSKNELAKIFLSL